MFCRGKIIRLSLILLFASFSTPLVSKELTTNYYSYADGMIYQNLHAAENALWNSAYIGSSHYEYQYTDGRVRKYQHPPTTAYFEDPRLVFWSSPGISCNNCPLYDRFGNDRCSNVSWGQGCASEENWWEGVQKAFSSIDCPPVKTGEGAWERVFLGKIGYPMVFPGEYLMLQARYSKFIDAEFPPGNSPLCGTSHDFRLTAIAPAYCEGYPDFQWVSGVGYQCLDNRVLRILSFGAAQAEPSPNACTVGNPCLPATGDKTLAEPDFNSRTLPFTRHYHSRQIYPDYAAMGKGWSHSYIGRVIVEADMIKLIDGEGDAERFRCTDRPACTAWASESEAGHILRPVAGGWDVYFKSGELRQYDSSGKLIFITHRSGDFREIAIMYNDEGLISQVADQFGRALQFAYNANRLVESITLPDGRKILYDYASPASDTTNNPRFNLVKVTRADSTRRLYHYEDKDGFGADRHGHLLTGITDEKGVRFASYSYDHAARVVSSEHAGGAERVELNYTRRPGESFDWSITEVTMPLGEVVAFDMEPGPYRKPTGIEGTRGTMAMSYDAATGWQTSKTDREGQRSIHTYDSLHETSRTEAAGTTDERVIETDWDDVINRVSERREPGKTTSYTYNSRGQVLTRTVKDTGSVETRAWTYTYFEAPALAPLIGQIQSVNGPREDVSDITNYLYYTTDHPGGNYLIGDLKAVVNALGHRTTYLKYDGNGRPLEIQDANNVVTRLRYYGRGWISSQSTDGKATMFAYDNVGNLTLVTQPDKRYVAYEYDEAHRLTAIRDRLNNRIEYTLDAEGNRISEKTYDEGGELRRQMGRVFDSLNRLESLIDGNYDQTRYEYDGNGNRIGLQDPNLNTTSLEYDALDRLVNTIDSIQGETRMEYDDRDNLVGVIDPLGNVTRYGYDGLDNQTRLNSPDTGVTSHEYDDAGNRTAATDARGIRTEYSYDALNRLTGISYPDSTLDVSFTYDAGTNGKGRLSRMTDAAGTVDYAYDSRGNLLSETRSIGFEQYLTSYAYNIADRLISITYPSGMVLDYTLDATGRIAAIDTAHASLVSDIRYEPFGPVKSFNYGNGLSYSAAFDLDYQLDQLQSGSALDWRFTRDAVGNLQTITDQVNTQGNQVFTYDDLYRMKTAQGDYGDEIFEYDANGNRTRVLGDLTDDSYAYEPESNRLAAQGNWSFTRDAAGNRTEKLDAGGHGQLYAFGDHQRLSQIRSRNASGDAIVVAYQYDGKGQRTGKLKSGGEVHYIHGPSGELLGEYSSSPGGDFKEYVYLGGHPVAVIARSSETVTQPREILVLDNGEPGTGSTGSWTPRTGSQDFGDDYLLAGETPDQTYRWTVTPPGINYEVYAWWVGGKKHATNVTYTIRYGTGQKDTIVKSHRSGGGRWQLLGVYHSADGTDYVEVSSEDRMFVADAIRWVRLDEPVSSAMETTHFIHFDHLGTPRRVTDDHQTVVWRWDSTPFGDSSPDEDPDRDSEDYVLNLRFPGQYYDAESGLHYNYFRTYDPGTGRYIESDPIGLGGGLNTYGYVLSAPVQFIDPQGLKVTGEWIEQPKLNVTDYGLTGGEFITPYLTKWGYLKVFRVYGYAAGFVNLDVRCEDTNNCGEREWEIHKRIGVSFNGYKDLGPNAAASAIGSAATPAAGLATGIVTLGGSALTSLLEFLQEAERRGGDKIQWLYQIGPTAICMGTQ